MCNVQCAMCMAQICKWYRYTNLIKTWYMQGCLQQIQCTSIQIRKYANTQLYDVQIYKNKYTNVIETWYMLGCLQQHQQQPHVRACNNSSPSRISSSTFTIIKILLLILIRNITITFTYNLSSSLPSSTASSKASAPPASSLSTASFSPSPPDSPSPLLSKKS